MNAFAIAAISLSLCGGVLGIVFGLVSLRQIRRTGERGRGLAITALALSGITILAMGGLAATAFEPAVSRDRGGAITESVTVSPFSLHKGDCIEQFTDYSYDGGRVTAVPCTSPHTGEVYAVLALKDGQGDRTVGDRCASEIKFVVPPHVANQYFTYGVYPDNLSRRLGTNQIVCIAWNSQERTRSMFD